MTFSRRLHESIFSNHNETFRSVYIFFYYSILCNWDVLRRVERREKICGWEKRFFHRLNHFFRSFTLWPFHVRVTSSRHSACRQKKEIFKIEKNFRFKLCEKKIFDLGKFFGDCSDKFDTEKTNKRAKIKINYRERLPV